MGNKGDQQQGRDGEEGQEESVPCSAVERLTSVVCYPIRDFPTDTLPIDDLEELLVEL